MLLESLDLYLEPELCFVANKTFMVYPNTAAIVPGGSSTCNLSARLKAT